MEAYILFVLIVLLFGEVFTVIYLDKLLILVKKLLDKSEGGDK